jgi:predicted metal-binding protein
MDEEIKTNFLERFVRFNEQADMFEVMSSSNSGVWYSVDLREGESCECKGFSYRGRCKHIDLARRFSKERGIIQPEMAVVGDDDLPF